MNLSDQVSGQWFLLLNQVVEYAAELLKESQQHEVFTNGASQLLKFPEFRDIDKAPRPDALCGGQQSVNGRPGGRTRHADPDWAGKRQRCPEGEQLWWTHMTSATACGVL